MQNLPIVVYRYYLFTIAIISNAIICSAAAWNLPITQNTKLQLSAQLHIDTYMIFLGAFSLLVLISMLFTDVLSVQPFTGRVWVECLWVDFLWLLHFVGAVVVTTDLPHAMCIPRVERFYGYSCTSVKLLMAFSWICTINLFVYLIFLVGSALLHQNRDSTVWSAQVRSYPWYLHNYCHKLGSSPELPQPYDPAPISAPQPWRPIRLPRLSVISSLYRARTPSQSDRASQHVAPQPTMTQQAGLMSTGRTSLYPLHVLPYLEPTHESEPKPELEPAPAGSHPLYPRFVHPQQHPRGSVADGGTPPPLLNWPRADIMLNPPPRGKIARKKVPASTLQPIPAPPRRAEGGEGPQLSVPSGMTRISPEFDRRMYG